MIVVQTLSVLPSPFATLPAESNHLLHSVVAYLHLALWAIVVNRGVGTCSIQPASEIGLRRSTGWLATGLVVIVFFVAVLGPGLGPLGDDPRLHEIRPWDRAR